MPSVAIQSPIYLKRLQVALKGSSDEVSTQDREDMRSRRRYWHTRANETFQDLSGKLMLLATVGAGFAGTWLYSSPGIAEDQLKIAAKLIMLGFILSIVLGTWHQIDAHVYFRRRATGDMPYELVFEVESDAEGNPVIGKGHWQPAQLQLRQWHFQAQAILLLVMILMTVALIAFSS